LSQGQPAQIKTSYSNKKQRQRQAQITNISKTYLFKTSKYE